jgi:hypothetical protein
VTESIAPRTLALPFFNRITSDQQIEVARTLRMALEEPSGLAGDLLIIRTNPADRWKPFLHFLAQI